MGGTELAAQKAKLQNLSDETHVVLKKNVFQHYGQFIDTAKDISCTVTHHFANSQLQYFVIVECLTMFFLSHF